MGGAMSAIEDVTRLLATGYVPYHGVVDGSVYERLKCLRPKRARWFTRDTRKICVGCSNHCAVADSLGFELTLPVSGRAKRLCFAVLPAVSALELLEKKLFLTVPEAEFVLNVSTRTVYNLLEEGRLERHPDPPTRITAASVRQEAERREGVPAQ